MNIEEIQVTLDKLIGDSAGIRAYNKFLAAGYDFKIHDMMEILLELCMKGIDYHDACEMVLNHHEDLRMLRTAALLLSCKLV